MPSIADIHVMINHFPVILAVVGTFFAVVALFAKRRGVWQYATATLFLAGLAAVPTYFTGEPAEDGLRQAWWITRRSIHTHEEAGEFALWSLIVAGLIAGYAWWRLRSPRPLAPSTGEPGTMWGARQLPVWLRALVLVSSLFATVVVYRAAKLGGDISHHSTVLQSTPRPASVPVEQPPPRGER